MPGEGARVSAAAVATVAAADELPAGPALAPRRPLVGRSGEVAGFELHLAPMAERFVAARAGSPGAALHCIGLLNSAAAVGASGRRALLRLPPGMVQRPQVAAAAGAGMLLWLDDLGALAPEQAAGLRARGARLGVSDGPPRTEGAPDFVVMHVGPGGIDTLLLSAQRWRELLPRVEIVALGLRHVEDMEAALQGAANLAGGQLARSRDAPPPRPLGAAAHRICELLNHLALDRDTAVVADAVRQDAALTYRLLRYANSPAIGARQPVQTVQAAVQLLGRRELQRWLSVQLLSAGTTRQAAAALEEGALARGRLLEALASRRGEAQPGAQFTLGLLSMIEPLLQLPLADAIAPLRLGDEVQDALLRRQGPWADRLDLLDALDGGDTALAVALAAGWGLAEDELARLQEAAWGWAASVQEKGPA